MKRASTRAVRLVDGVPHLFCRGCREWHPADQFPPAPKNQRGPARNGKMPRCRRWISEYEKRRRRANKARADAPPRETPAERKARNERWAAKVAAWGQGRTGRPSLVETSLPPLKTFSRRESP